MTMLHSSQQAIHGQSSLICWSYALPGQCAKAKAISFRAWTQNKSRDWRRSIPLWSETLICRAWIRALVKQSGGSFPQLLPYLYSASRIFLNETQTKTESPQRSTACTLHLNATPAGHHVADQGWYNILSGWHMWQFVEGNLSCRGRRRRRSIRRKKKRKTLGLWLSNADSAGVSQVGRPSRPSKISADIPSTRAQVLQHPLPSNKFRHLYTQVIFTMPVETRQQLRYTTRQASQQAAGNILHSGAELEAAEKNKRQSKSKTPVRYLSQLLVKSAAIKLFVWTPECQIPYMYKVSITSGARQIASQSQINV